MSAAKENDWGKRGERRHPLVVGLGDAGAPFFAGVSLDAADGSGRGTVTLRGELDLATKPVADEALRRAERLADLVVLDLRDVSFMDSAGVHLVVDTNLRQHAAGGRLVVIASSPQIRRVLELAQVAEQLDIVDDIAATQ